jgi:hypothetical protein
MIIGYFKYKFNHNFSKIEGIFFNNYSNINEPSIKTKATRGCSKNNTISGLYKDTWAESEEITRDLKIEVQNQYVDFEWGENEFFGRGIIEDNNTISGFYSDKNFKVKK